MGKRWGKEAARPRFHGASLPSPSYQVSEKARNSACEEYPTFQRDKLLAEDEERQKQGPLNLFSL